MTLTTFETKLIGDLSMADPVVKRINNYTDDYSSSETHSSEERTKNPSSPRMQQGDHLSSKSSTPTYPHSTRNIEDDVKKDIEKTHELNAEKEELWAKFSEKTEVNVVTRLDYLSSSDIGELSKWLREKAHPQINVLSISKSDIDDKAAKALAKAIKPKSTLDKLTTLKLGHKLSKLTTLELLGNTISDEGFKTLAKVIQNNTTITTLKIELVGNTDSDEGIKALTNAIQNNHTITSLTIYASKRIGSGGFDALVELVKTTETIKQLKYEGFCLTNIEVESIISASSAKCKIESLYCS